MLFTGSWGGESFHGCVRFGTFHTSRPLEICSVLVRQTPHRIAREDPSGHRMVRLQFPINIQLPSVESDVLHRSIVLYASWGKYLVLHHLIEMALRSLWLVKMIDKLWYDWQIRNPASAYSFSGGSVQGNNTIYPTGAPPNLTVSTGQ